MEASVLVARRVARLVAKLARLAARLVVRLAMRLATRLAARHHRLGTRTLGCFGPKPLQPPLTGLKRDRSGP